MKKAVVATLLVVLLVAVWSVPAQTAWGAPKPLAVMSFSGYDEWKGDIAYVGQLSDNPELAVGLEGLLEFLTRGRGMEGLDKTRPWGAVLQMDGDKPIGCAFIPVTNLAALMDVLGPMTQGVEQEGDLWRVEMDDDTLFVKGKGGWAYAANKKEMLDQVPADPMKIIGDLNEQYDMAVRLHVANVPQKYRRQLIDKMNADAASDLQRKPGEEEEEYLVRKMVIESILDGVTQAVEELEQLTLGWALDHNAEKTYIDVTASARPGTDLAARLGQMATSKTNFAGFQIPGAAFTAGWAGANAVDAAKVKQVMEMLRKEAMEEIDAQDKPDSEKELAKQLLGDVMDVIRDTVAAEKADGGASVIATPDAVTLVAGGFVADGAKLEGVAKQVAELAKNENPVVGDWLKLDADKYRGVNLHLVSIPIPPDANDREKVVRLIGETLDVVVGMGAESIYMAAGRDAMKTLKMAIAESAEQSFRTAAPLELALALQPIMKFMAEVGDDEDRENAAMVAGLLEKTGDRDHVKLTVTPIERGARMRLELEEGILRLIGKMSTLRDN